MPADEFQNFPDIEETGTTLEANARLKANGIAKFTGLAALADDSGLEVEALDGAPGVYSSRYAGDNVTYEDNNRKLVKELTGVPTEKRGAQFRCVMTICWDGENIESVEGAVDGVITEDLAGHDGFGYDPVFFHPPSKKRFSEMTIEEKNLVSHRGLALQKIRTVIIEHLNRART